MKLVLDSSAISAIFFREEASEAVEEKIKIYDTLLTVDLAYSELLNIAWKRVTFFKEDKKIIFQALKEVLRFLDNVCSVVSAKDIVEDAFEIATSLEITGYDALFIALAKREGALFLTLDNKLKNKLENAKYRNILVTL